MRFQPGEGPSRGLLRDCTTGCGTDGSICGTNVDSIATLHEKLPFILSRDGILIVPGKNAHEMG